MTTDEPNTLQVYWDDADPRAPGWTVRWEENGSEQSTGCCDGYGRASDLLDIAEQVAVTLALGPSVKVIVYSPGSERPGLRYRGGEYYWL